MARSAGQTTSIEDRSGFISADAVALGAMAMVTERGPIGEAREITTWEEFLRTYGDHVTGYVGTRAAKRALEAGCALLVSRVVHFSDITDFSTKTSAAAEITAPDRSTTPGHGRSTGAGTFPAFLVNGQTVLVTRNGTGPTTATFAGFARRLTGTSGTYAAVTAAHVLVLVVGGITRSVAFAGTENTAPLFAAAINAGIPGVYADVGTGEVRITTDKKGSGAALTVHATTSSDVLASLGITSGQVAVSLGSNNVADIEAVSAAEFTAIVEGAVSGTTAGADADGHPYIESTTTGSGSTITVGGGSTATAFGFDSSAHAGAATSAIDTLTFVANSDGAWAHGLRIVIDAAQGDPTNRFRVRVQDTSGRTLETFGELSMTTTDARYVVNVLRDESVYFTVTDEGSATAAPDDQPLAGTYTPAGGDDGLASLDYVDYVGNFGDAAERTGLNAFNTESDFRLASMPGVTDHDAHVAGTAWARALTEARYVGTIPSTITTVAGAKAFRRRVAPYASGVAIDDAYGALYSGWHRLRDPRTRADVWVPAEGEVYAALAEATREAGPWMPMAGQKRAKLSPEVQTLKVLPGPDDLAGMVAAGVNPFYRDPSAGFVIEGQATLQKEASQLSRLNACILVDYVSEQVRNGNAVDRHDPNDETLWRQIRDRSNAFLTKLAGKRGTFETDGRGAPRFRVVCDASNNTPSEVAAHRTNILVGFVPQASSEEQVIDLAVYPPGTALAA